MGKKKKNPLDGIKFTAEESGCYFQCDSAVFPLGNGSSLCYTTSLERAECITAALNDRTTLLEDNEKLKKALATSQKEANDLRVRIEGLLLEIEGR